MEVMKLISIFGVALVALLALVSVRENLILQEIQSLQLGLISEARQELSRSSEIEDLRKLERSNATYQRYIRPVNEKIQSLLWPPLRQKSLTAWSDQFFSHIETDMDLKKAEIESDIKAEIQEITQLEEAGQERLMKVLAMSQALPQAEERLEWVQKELAAIESSLNEKDREVLSEIRSAGISGLRNLRQFLADNKSEADLVSYLSSRAFYAEVLESVSDKILSLHQEDLRKLTWNEFSMQLLKTLNRQNQRLARLREREKEESQKSAIADLLLQRYQQELQNEGVSEADEAIEFN